MRTPPPPPMHVLLQLIEKGLLQNCYQVIFWCWSISIQIVSFKCSILTWNFPQFHARTSILQYIRLVLWVSHKGLVRIKLIYEFTSVHFFLSYSFFTQHNKEIYLNSRNRLLLHSAAISTYPLPWATGRPSIPWDTTGRPNEYLQGTLEHHCKN